MKPIDQMNLAECLERLRELPSGTITDPFETGDAPWIFDVCIQLADRIHELTLWIPVSERMPTRQDADENGNVEFWDSQHRLSYYDTYNTLSQQYAPELTHWKRITSPEDKP